MVRLDLHFLETTVIARLTELKLVKYETFLHIFLNADTCIEGRTASRRQPSQLGVVEYLILAG